MNIEGGKEKNQRERARKEKYQIKFKLGCKTTCIVWIRNNACDFLDFLQLYLHLYDFLQLETTLTLKNKTKLNNKCLHGFRLRRK